MQSIADVFCPVEGEGQADSPHLEDQNAFGRQAAAGRFGENRTQTGQQLDGSASGQNDFWRCFGEAKHITWADCDFERGKIAVSGSPETGLKGRQVGESRDVPMIPDMWRLLEKMKIEQSDALSHQSVMRVFKCKKFIFLA